MANSIMSVGVSGLQAAQVALLTTSHNISNATTPGYNRQQAIQSTNTPLAHGNGFIGRGVQVSTVQRIYSQYLVNQSLQAQTQSSQLDSHYNEIKQIDNLLADTTSGLTPALHNFFNAVQDMASNPTSIPSRQAVLSNAEALVSRFQQMDQRLSEMREGVNSQITSSVAEINSLAQQIAGLNTNIQAVEASANGQPANDLRDQRDTLIRDLSKLANVDVVRQNNGHYNVFIGNGQSLVVGSSAMTLKAVASPNDPQRLVMAMDLNNTEVLLPEHQLQGGSLGGLLAFRSETLDSVQNSFDQLAQGIAQTFNTQHQAGLDLQGAAGENFFAVTDPNHAAGSIRVAINDPAEIAAADDDGGVMNNVNALKLAGLQTENILPGGTSYQSAYASLVSQVGNKTRELEVTSKAQESMLNQTDQALQSLSGVNLEEEAANLLRYQQMFQASSKVIEIGNSLFDSLLRI
ncbi:flagellar hook-associated protein FlgK [Nitrosomonas sp.]|uniref:flagellar hook-associated protein FlgK n=1 Tax=Nitrosomonas sp. TaxID=42353 RepID=UPI003305CF1A